MKTMNFDDLKKMPNLNEGEIEKLNNIEAIPTEDFPELTEKQLNQLRPWYEVHPKVSPVYNLTIKKEHISLRIDSDILNVFKSKGKGYQTRINDTLRKAINSGWV